MARSYLAVPYTTYFHDATIQEWGSLRGSGQRAVRQLMKMLGTPFAAAKQQDMDTKGTFLALSHDTSEAISRGRVHFWVRQQLEDKLVGMITEARTRGALGPGAAAELYGMAARGKSFCTMARPRHERSRA